MRRLPYITALNAVTSIHRKGRQSETRHTGRGDVKTEQRERSEDAGVRAAGTQHKPRVTSCRQKLEGAKDR